MPLSKKQWTHISPHLPVAEQFQDETKDKRQRQDKRQETDRTRDRDTTKDKETRQEKSVLRFKQKFCI